MNDLVDEARAVSEKNAHLEEETKQLRHQAAAHALHVKGLNDIVLQFMEQLDERQIPIPRSLKQRIEVLAPDIFKSFACRSNATGPLTPSSSNTGQVCEGQASSWLNIPVDAEPDDSLTDLSCFANDLTFSSDDILDLAADDSTS